MSWQLLAGGDWQDPAEETLFARYNQRLRPRLRLVAYEKLRRLPSLSGMGLCIALDERGTGWRSRALAHQLEKWLARGPLCFMIGGADGLPAGWDRPVDVHWSLGPATFPHSLCRVLVAEQIYRAQSILAGHPYHRE